MKKVLLSIALIAASFVSNAQAPLVVNGDFEAAVTAPLAGIGQTTGWGTGVFTTVTGANAFAGTQSAKIITINSPQINQAVGWGSDTIPGFIQQQITGIWNRRSLHTKQNINHLHLMVELTHAQ
jgi:hypothetical protein